MALGGVEIGSDMAQLADTATPMRMVEVPPMVLSLSPMPDAYHREDRDEQGGGGGVGDEVTQNEAYQSGYDHDDQRIEFCKRNALYGCLGKTGAVHRQSEGESACHHPDDSPVNLLQVLGCNHSRKGEYGDREHGHGVGVDAQLLAEYPEHDGCKEGDGHYRGAPVVLHVAPRC